ncbi:hypothetical protein H072_3643 [Dactylellina haptotyla CBS 200.50]|uniref:AMP-dependent synthetase/ligase domain-containing protein n=1 Tax=Dactylellina haptotyla (strain CBS 200.50) TaxID=1284197 RepID=S8AMV9_DACHA|nr:hypothetical protein H072_3643 [Dactylellina haptotyla CBS 200.50]
MDTGFTLQQVLAVAKLHPLYNPDVVYPPTPTDVSQIAREAECNNGTDIDLSAVPLSTKETLYPTLNRLFSDTSAQNTFRTAAYISTTGGGSGGLPMVFATDVIENRNHRAAAGALAKACGLIEPGDVILTMHVSGALYRSLNLMTEIFEMAGGTVFCAGHKMTMPVVIEAIIKYKVNVISGDGSQVLYFANFVAGLPDAERSKINISKVIYTSDPLNTTQRRHVSSALGARIFSIIGSCEAGAWGVANMELTGEPDEGVDFIFDTRMIRMEILPASIMENPGQKPNSLPDGEAGIIVQTSLSRLRNPLIRYISGDMGCLRPFPREKFANMDTEHLKVVRVYGRDRRFSFKWFGEYFEFARIRDIIQKTEEWGVLQYQIILENVENEESQLELRLYRSKMVEGPVLEAAIRTRLEGFFVVFEQNRHLFKVTFIDAVDEFERSKTGSKVMNFVDRRAH